MDVDALVEALRRALDKEERLARATAAADVAWTAETTGPYGPRVRTGEGGDNAQWGRTVNVSMWVCDDELDGCPDIARGWIAEAEHIASWDPARVLRLVAAHRRILDLHAEAVEEWERAERARPTYMDRDQHAAWCDMMAARAGVLRIAVQFIVEVYGLEDSTEEPEGDDHAR